MKQKNMIFKKKFKFDIIQFPLNFLIETLLIKNY